VINVGFIGVGQMGRPMVDRLVAARWPVTVFVRRPVLADELRQAGVAVVPSITDAAEQAEMLFVCTFSDDQLRAVVFGADGTGGALGALRPGALLVNHTTGSPALASEMAASAPPGVGVVDGPVSGTADQIRAGRLTVLIGASAEDFERVRPVVAAYASTIIHVGEVGDAQRVKLVNNLLFTVHLRIAVRAAELASTMGIGPAALAQAVGQCSGASRAVDLLAERRVDQLMAGARPYLAKDVATVRSVARELGVDLGELGELAGWVFES
jgi:3-hydroxyisobutyrate dehydrogenase-like beta-hydroxyacid dehydrogenase